MKKYIVGAILSVGLLIFPAFTQAAGLSEIQIQAILSLLSSFGANQSVIDNVQVSLTGGTPTIEKKSFCHNFNKDLTVGSRGDEVSALNQALTASGIDTTGNSANFSEDNAGDVVAFQAKYGIRQTGYVGPMTRAKLNALHRCRDEQKPTFVPQPIQPHKSCPTTMDIISCEAGSHAGGLCNRECIPDNTPTLSVSEQVKCVFNGATTEQKCWGTQTSSMVGSKEALFNCSGIGTCVVTVNGQKGTSIHWGSSCGGSSTTSIDGGSEYANFSCANIQTTQTIQPTVI